MMSRFIGMAAMGLFAATGCAQQHYVVQDTSQTDFPAAYELKALDARVNGYSITVKNTSGKSLEINWDDARIRQPGGFEVPVGTVPSSKLSRIHSGSVVEYHLRPTHIYQPPERRGKTANEIWWHDLSHRWPSIKQTLIIPVRFVDPSKCDECGWRLAHIMVSQVAKRGGKTQEDERWYDDWGHTPPKPIAYGPPPESKKLRARIGLGMGTIKSYDEFSGTSFILESGYAFDSHFSADVVGQFSDFDTNSGSDSKILFSQYLGARFGFTYPLYAFISVVTYGQAGLLNSDYETGSRSDGFSWTQSDLLLGGGGRVLMSFPNDVQAFIGYELNQGVATQLPTKTTLKLAGVSASRSVQQQLGAGLGYVF